MTARDHQIQLPGLTLHARVEGQGPALLLLHSHTFDHTFWNLTTHAFAPHFTVIRPDLRGYGRSGVPHGPYWFVDDLTALLDQLGVPRAHLLGHGLGGNIALEFAWQFKERTDRLVLAPPSLKEHPWHREFDAPPLLTVALHRVGLAYARDLWLRWPFFSGAQLMGILGSHLPALVSGYSGWHWQEGRSPFEGVSAAVTEALEGIQVPTLLLGGDRDVPEYLEIARQLTERLPDVKRVVMERVGHLSPLENHRVFEETVLSFLLGP